jgi:hypothetical protein
MCVKPSRKPMFADLVRKSRALTYNLIETGNTTNGGINVRHRDCKVEVDGRLELMSVSFWH